VIEYRNRILENTLKELKIDRKKAESELRGTTLRVYWELFKKNRPLGVREVQRSLRLSSPSTSLYHLEKIRELGVAEKNRHGQYSLSSEIKVGNLRQFVRFGRLILPRYIFYAAFFWSALFFYLIESLIANVQTNFTAVAFVICAIVVTTYEASRTWRERLF
jgi:DNA-binding transcriptional ArsR family regulator